MINFTSLKLGISALNHRFREQSKPRKLVYVCNASRHMCSLYTYCKTVSIKEHFTLISLPRSHNAETTLSNQLRAARTKLLADWTLSLVIFIGLLLLSNLSVSSPSNRFGLNIRCLSYFFRSRRLECYWISENSLNPPSIGAIPTLQVDQPSVYFPIKVSSLLVKFRPQSPDHGH